MSNPLSEAQTAMFLVLETMVRLMAPILSFTAEEVWEHIPDHPGKTESVHLADMPRVDEDLVDEELAERWDRLLQVRAAVTKALEEARREKTIGHPLDAEVRMFAASGLYDLLAAYQDLLREVFIVSRVELAEGDPPPDARVTDLEGLALEVKTEAAPKCERCWVHDESVGTIPDHPGICRRCLNALED